jgi:hypothetical protein
VDGLTFHKGSFVAIQNGIMSPGVSRIVLKNSGNARRHAAKRAQLLWGFLGTVRVYDPVADGVSSVVEWK